MTARLKRLVEDTDTLSDGWLSHAKGLLQQCKVHALSHDLKTWPHTHGPSLCEGAELAWLAAKHPCAPPTNCLPIEAETILLFTNAQNGSMENLGQAE